MASNSTAAAVQHLQTLLPDDGRTALCTSVLPALLDSIAAISSTLRASHQVFQAGGTNPFGDNQLNVDVSAENHVREALARCPAVATASSEEDPVERPSGSRRGDQGQDDRQSETYTVAFDPLDGSSIIAPNWTVGTIAGIWDGPTALNKDPSTHQVAAVLGVYGPRTTAVVALRVPGQPAACVELGLAPASGDSEDVWIVVRPAVQLAALGTAVKTRYMAPSNLRNAAHDVAYRELLLSYVDDRYTLRYAGGLVPDIVHTLVQGHGIYVSPVMDASKAKLRSLYELCPVALVMECAGGKAVNSSTGRAVLETLVAGTDERGGLICGTAAEVDTVVQRLGMEKRE